MKTQRNTSWIPQILKRRHGDLRGNRRRRILMAEVLERRQLLAADLQGDDLASAQVVSLAPDTMTAIDASIGDGDYGDADIDLFKIDLLAGQTVNVDVDAHYLDNGFSQSFDTDLRVFDGSGNLLQFNGVGHAANDYQSDPRGSIVAAVRVRLTDTDYLSMNEVEVLERGTGTNLALAGTASQSSTYDAYSGAEKAIDGDTTSDPISVNATNSEYGAWWEVDLGDRFDVGTITVYNRQVVGTRLNDAVVEALDSTGKVVWSDTITGAVDGSIHQFSMSIPLDTSPPIAALAQPASGGAVELSTINGPNYIDVTYSDIGGGGPDLTTVNGDEFTLSGSGVGTANLIGTATLVSGTTYRYGFTGDFAVGNVDVNFAAGSWYDDVGNASTAMTESFSVQADATAVTIASVRVRLTDTDYLNMNEVTVVEQGTGVNLALAGTATQSSTYNAYTGPEKAIDGDTTSGYPTSIMNTNYEFGAWWSVDLGGTFDVGTITVYNRQVVGSRLNNAVVEALDISDNVVWSDTITGAFDGSVHPFSVSLAPDTQSPTAGLADPNDGGSISVNSINARKYIDVTYSDLGASGLNMTTIDGDEFTMSGAGLGTASLDGSAILMSGTTYRYGITGDFAVGTVAVNFAAGTWQDKSGNANVVETESFIVNADSPAGSVAAVRVRLTDTDFLNMNEVKVIEEGTGINLALAGTATQSSTYSSSTGPEKANDGDTTSDPASVNATNSEFGAWWKVDLGGAFDVETITVYNRQVVGTRLNDAVVEALDSAGNVVWSNAITGAVNGSIHPFSVSVPSDTTLPFAELAAPNDGAPILLGTINSRSYVDVTFQDAGGLDLTTIDGDEFLLSGTGAGTAALVGAAVLVGGTTYRYAVSGDFAVGQVNLNWIAGSWKDTAGNLNQAGVESFTVQSINDLDSYVSFTAAISDTYYFAVSAAGNTNYDPSNAGTGTSAETGTYKLQLQVDAASPPGGPGGEQIVDDGDNDFSIPYGSWSSDTQPGSYGDDRRYIDSASGSATAVWQFDTIPGGYDLASAFAGQAGYSADTPVRVLDIATSSVLLDSTLDQSSSPSSTQSEPVGWRNIGRFNAIGQSIYVELSNVGASGGNVVADAMRLRRVPNAEFNSAKRVADFDGDGTLDTWSLTEQNVWIEILSGGIPYHQTASISGSGPDVSVYAFDSDADGDEELVVYAPSTGTWTVHEVGISGPTIVTSLPASLIHSGDFEGNDTESWVYCRSDGALFLLDGENVSQVAAAGEFLVNQPLRVLDLNLDGRSDLISQQVNGSVVNWIGAVSMVSGSQTSMVVQDWNAYFDHPLAPSLMSSPDEDLQLPLLTTFNAFQTASDDLRFTPSAGHWKHPEQTIDSGSGNAWDQTIALQSMLEGQNYLNPLVDTQVEIGRTTFSGVNFAWLGVDNFNAAVNVLEVAGLNPIVNGSTIEFDHARLQAWLPGPQGLQWTVLDPSITSGTLLREQPPALPSGGTASDPWLSRIAPTERTVSVDFEGLGVPNVTPTEQQLRYSRYLSLTAYAGFHEARFADLASSGPSKPPSIATVRDSDSNLGSVTADVYLPNENDVVRLWAHLESEFPVALSLRRVGGSIYSRFESDAFVGSWNISQGTPPDTFTVTLTSTAHELIADVPSATISTETTSLFIPGGAQTSPIAHNATRARVLHNPSNNYDYVLYRDVSHFVGKWGFEVINGDVGSTGLYPGIEQFDLTYYEPDLRSPLETILDAQVDLAADVSDASLGTTEFVPGSSPSLWAGEYVSRTTLESFLTALTSPPSAFQSASLTASLPNDQYPMTTIELFEGVEYSSGQHSTSFVVTDATQFPIVGNRFDGSDPIYSYTPFAEYEFRVADLVADPPTFAVEHADDGKAIVVVQGATPTSTSGTPSGEFEAETVVGVAVSDSFGGNFSELSRHDGIRTTLQHGQQVTIGVAGGQSSGETVRESWSEAIGIARKYYDPNQTIPPQTFEASDDRDFVTALSRAALDELAYHARKSARLTAAAADSEAVFPRPGYVFGSIDLYSINGQFLAAAESFPEDPTLTTPLLPLYLVPDDFSLSTSDLGLSAVPLDGSTPNMSAGPGFDAGLNYAYEIAFLQEDLVGRPSNGPAIGLWSRTAESEAHGKLVHTIDAVSQFDPPRDSVWNRATHQWDYLAAGYPSNSTFGGTYTGAEWQGNQEHNLLRNALVEDGYIVVTPVVRELLGSFVPIHPEHDPSGSDQVRLMTAYRPGSDRFDFANFVVANGRILGAAFQSEFNGLADASSDGDYTFDQTTDHLGDRTSDGSANLSSGENAPVQTDIVLPSIGPSVGLSRRHVLDNPDPTNATDLNVTGFGPGWSHSYADVIEFVPQEIENNEIQEQGLRWRTSSGTEHFFRFDSVASSYQPSAEFRGWSIESVGVGYELRSVQGDSWLFATSTANSLQYFVVEKSDRFGNRAIIERDAIDPRRVLAVKSQPAGEANPATRLTFLWSGDHIVAVVDDIGRRWQYKYDADDDDDTLDIVTEPPTAMGVAGQTAYEYRTGAGNRIESIKYRKVTLEPDLPDEDGNLKFATDTEVDPSIKSYEYYGDGRLSQSNDEVGGVTTLLINPWLRRRTTIDERGDLTRYVVDRIGQTVRTENAKGDAWRQEWDIHLQTMTSSTDPLGAVTQYEYDDIGNMTAAIEPTGLRHEIEYEANFQQPISYRRGRDFDTDGTLLPTSTENFQTTWVVNPTTGLTESQTDPLGRVTRFEYDGRGQLTFLTTPRGEATGELSDFRTQYVYDVNGLVTDIYEADPDGTGALASPHWQFSYRGDGALLQVTDPLNVPVDYVPDVLGRVIEMRQVDPDGLGPLEELVTTYARDYRGNLDTTTDPRGVSKTYTYDLKDRLISIVDESGIGMSWTFDGVDRITHTSDGIGTWETIYDEAGLPTASVDPIGRVTRAIIDPNGRSREQRDPRGAIDRFHYDLGGRLQTSIDPRNRETSYGYDDHDRLSTVTVVGDTGSSFDHRYYYDSADQMVGYVSPIFKGGVSLMQVPASVYRYDLDGNLDRVTQLEESSFFVTTAPDTFNTTVDGLATAERRITEFTYDDLGRNTLVTFNDATTEGYRYDSLGRVGIQTDRRGGETVYGFDDVGWLQTVTLPDPDGVGPFTSPIWNYDWDESSNITRITDPNGNATQRVFDDANRLERTINAELGVTQFGYDSAGRQVTQIDPRGSLTSYEFDDASQLVGMTLPDPDGSNPLPSPTYDFSYDGSGNLTSVTDHLGRSDDYFYDLIGRITQWQEPSPSPSDPRPTHTWSYGTAATDYHWATGDFDNVVYTDPTGRAQSTHFDALGRLKRQSFIGRGGHDDYYYNRYGEVDQIHSAGSDQILYNVQSAFQLPADSLREIALFEYDAVGRLDTASIGGPNFATGGFDFIYHYDYDDNGNLSSFTDHQGIERKTEFDALNRPVIVTEAYGTVDAAESRYEYDAGNRLRGVMDPLGTITNYMYDDLDRRTSQTDDFGGSLQRSRSWSYDAVGNLSSEVDPRGTLTIWSYDALDRPTSETNDVGGSLQRTSTMDYDAAGNLAAFTNGRGDRVMWGYDDLDRPVSETLGAGTTDALTSQTTYDAAGRVVDLIDPELIVTHHTYDLFGRLSQSIADSGGPDESTAAYGYNSLARTLGVIVSQGPSGSSETITSHDLIGRQVSTIEGLGTADEISTLTSYDDVNRVVTMTDGEQNDWIRRYDHRGRLQETESPDPDGTGPRLPTLMTYQYNARGDQTGMTERLSATETATTVYIVDALGRRTDMIDPINRTTTTEYDVRDVITKVTDPGGSSLSYEYDNLGRMSEFDDGGGRILAYTYDDGDNLVSVTSPLNAFIYEFDSLGRMTRELRTGPSGSSDQFVHRYEVGSGQLESVTRSEIVGGVTTALSRESFEWDNLDRISEQTTSDLVAPGLSEVLQVFAYDDTGNLLSRNQFRIDSGTAILERTVTHQVDHLGRRTNTTEQDGQSAILFASSFAYDRRNLMTDTDRLDPLDNVTLSSDYIFDDAGYLQSLQHAEPGVGGIIYADYVYTRDAAGSIVEIDSLQDGLIEYGYDAADQLQFEKRDSVTIATYDWDAAGNRLTPGTVVGPGNRLSADGEFTYLYDAEGRRTQRVDVASGERTEYSYDAAGRLESATGYASSDPNSKLWYTETVFDAVGRRMTETSESYDGAGSLLSSETDRFDYEGWNTTSIRNDSGALQSSFVHGPGTDQVLAEIAYDAGGSAEPVVHALADHQGTIRDFAVYDSALTEMASVGHRDYDAFGKLRSSSYETGSSSSGVADAATTAADHLFGFTGREHTGQADRYDYRMRSYDAASGRFTQPDPLGLRAGDTNLYRYVGNDAVNYIDPLGLGITPVAGNYDNTVATDQNRHSPGKPDCGCPCSCEPSQVESANSQNSVAPAASDHSAKQRPELPSTRAGNGTRPPSADVSQGPNLTQFVGSNPVNATDPTGQMVFSQDPIGFAAGDANLYRYVGNGPTTKTDPTGLEETIPLVGPDGEPWEGPIPQPLPPWYDPHAKYVKGVFPEYVLPAFLMSHFWPNCDGRVFWFS